MTKSSSKNNKNVALITGASSGFGLEFAKLCAQDGYDLALTARPNSELADVVKKLQAQYSIKIWQTELDLSVPGAATKLFEWTKKEGLNISVLINNAGIGLYGRFTDHTLEQEQELINLDVNALSELCHLYIPEMQKGGGGKILNVASIAGLQAGPRYATYFASKGYVLLFSEALFYEYAPDNITVTALCPGVARTKFFKRAAMREDSKILQSYFMEPSRVAAIGYRAMQQGKRMIVAGKRNKFVALGYRVLPRSVINRIAQKLVLSAAE